MGYTMAAILTLLGNSLVQHQIVLAQAQHNVDPIRQGRNLRHSNFEDGILLHGNHDDASKILVDQNRNLFQCTDFGLEIQFDDFAHEVFWGLYSDYQFYSGYYNSSYNNAIVTENECIPPGSYNFTIYDSGDDGLCCAFGQGHYKYSLNQVWIHQGGQYGSEETTSFDVVASPTVSPSPTYGPWPTAAPSLAPTVSCASNEVTLGVEIQHDSSPWAISWNLTDSVHALVVSEEDYSYQMPYATSYREYCIARGAYKFTIYSAYGLFNREGSHYSVSLDGVRAFQGGDIWSSVEKNFATQGATLWPTVSPQPSASPTVSPQPTILWDDETFVPTSSPTSGPTVECASNEVIFELDIKLDYDQNETSWDLTDAAGSVLLSGQNYTYGQRTVHNELCLPAGTYVFTAYDTYGDGLCCNNGDGYYKLWMDGIAVKKGGIFGFQESTTIVSAP